MELVTGHPLDLMGFFAGFRVDGKSLGSSTGFALEIAPSFARKVASSSSAPTSFAMAMKRSRCDWSRAADGRLGIRNYLSKEAKELTLGSDVRVTNSQDHPFVRCFTRQPPFALDKRQHFLKTRC